MHSKWSEYLCFPCPLAPHPIVMMLTFPIESLCHYATKTGSLGLGRLIQILPKVIKHNRISECRWIVYYGKPQVLQRIQLLGFKQNKGTFQCVFVFYQLRTAGTMLKSVKSNKKPMKDILFWLADVYGFYRSRRERQNI